MNQDQIAKVLAGHGLNVASDSGDAWSPPEESASCSCGHEYDSWVATGAALVPREDRMSICPSDIHVEPEEATVRGMFANRYNPIMDGPAEFCAKCAAMGEAIGFFSPGLPT